MNQRSSMRSHAASSGWPDFDVFQDEPLPDTSPLLRMPNVVLTPHLGGGSYQGREADYRAGLANILRFFRGEKPAGVLNATSGRGAAT